MNSVEYLVGRSVRISLSMQVNCISASVSMHVCRKKLTKCAIASRLTGFSSVFSFLVSLRALKITSWLVDLLISLFTVGLVLRLSSSIIELSTDVLELS